jgi:pyruvate,water dikinase
MVVRSSDDFQVEWANPADAELTWNWDQAHAPRPLPPLAGEITHVMQTAASGGGRRRIFVNGFPYSAGGRPGGPPPPGSEHKTASQLWFEDLMPQVRASYIRLRDTDYDAMDAATLVDQIDDVALQLGNDFAKTMMPVGMGGGGGGGSRPFIDFCTAELGADGVQMATTMFQSVENDSATAGLELSRLAELAAESPELAKAIGAGQFDAIASLPGGEAFQQQLDMYLSEFGWRGEAFNCLHEPTWAEEPARCLRLVQAYLLDPSHAPRAAVERSREQRAEAILEAEARIAPEKIDEFRALLKEAETHVPLAESRARYQLTMYGIARRPVMALGRKLAASGALAKADDVFFVTLEELKRLAHDPSQKVEQSLIEQRRDDLARWERLAPPPFLGKRPEPGMGRGGGGGADLFGGSGVRQGEDSDVVTGNPAGRGTVRGRARVILTLADSGRLQPGDILVCPATAPPWTPLFAIAGAVVTDSGGILSHSAIAAREYAIPCVVGTVVGTRTIPDGAMITVDGTAGSVTIER